MTQSIDAEETAREALTSGVLRPLGSTPQGGWHALALDRADCGGVVLLVRNTPRAGRRWARFIAFASADPDWCYLFEHDEEWVSDPFARPTGQPALLLATGTRGDATSAGMRVASLAGVVSTEVDRIILEAASGRREVPISAGTGAFVVIATGGGPFHLSFRSRANQLLDTLSHSPPE